MSRYKFNNVQKSNSNEQPMPENCINYYYILAQ